MIIVLDLQPIFSTVPNRTFRENVIRNGILFTNIRSAVSVTARYRAIISSGRAAIGASCAACGARRTVLPCRDPTSGPKMSSAAMMSCRVTGQLARSFPSTSRSSSFVLGRPIMIWSFLATVARV